MTELKTFLYNVRNICPYRCCCCTFVCDLSQACFNVVGLYSFILKALQRIFVEIFRQTFVFRFFLRGNVYDVHLSMLWPVGSRENGTNDLKKYMPLKWFNLFFIQMLYFSNVLVKLLNIVFSWKLFNIIYWNIYY